MFLLKKKSAKHPKYPMHYNIITLGVWDLHDRHSTSKHFIPIHFYSKVFLFSDSRLLSSKVWFFILGTWAEKYFSTIWTELIPKWLNLLSLSQFFGWPDTLFVFVDISNYPLSQKKNNFSYSLNDPTVSSVWAGPGLVLCFLFIFTVIYMLTR